eukprot:gene9784-11427_t
MTKFNYPETRRDATVDKFKSSNGEKEVADPYRWLEDPKSEETKEWVKAQNKVTEEFLGGESGLTDRLQKELLERINYPKLGCVRRRGDKIFYDRNPGILNQSIIYMADVNNLDNEMVILDPNSFSADGTWSLSYFSITDSGKHIAYSFAKGGSDWTTIKIMRVPENIGDEVVTLEDTLEWVKFSSITWTPNEEGFIYNTFPAPASIADGEEKGTETDSNEFQKAHFHVIGTPQSEDRLVYESPSNPKWMFGFEFTNDHKSLLITTHKDCNPEQNLSIVYNWKDVLINKTCDKFDEIKLVKDFNASYVYIHNIGEVYYFQTNLNAPLSKIITMRMPAKEGEDLQIKDFIPEKEFTLQYASYNSNKFYVVYLKDIQDVVQVYDVKGNHTHDIPLPGPGCVSSFAMHHVRPHIYFTFQSWTYPGTVMYFNTSDDKVSVFKEPQIKGFNATDYVSKQIFYESPKDKTKIPMFIVHKKDLVLNGNNPTFMTAYGGFEISYSPYFSPSFIYFVDKFDGVFVVANIRGGGEYGKNWHKGGSLANKQNCFDDFCGAAEYLIDNKYTCSSKLAINGGSNGGLLVGAVTNQRPELFGAAIADVGVMDMLRFHKFTIGSHWTSDYGCADIPEEFDTLIKYSPIHNVTHNESKQYPHVLICTGDHDDRVIPAHSYKYIAELQHQCGNKPGQTNPLLILVDIQAGHGAGKPLSKRTREFCNKLTFISKAFGVVPK